MSVCVRVCVISKDLMAFLKFLIRQIFFITANVIFIRYLNFRFLIVFNSSTCLSIKENLIKRIFTPAGFEAALAFVGETTV